MQYARLTLVFLFCSVLFCYPGVHNWELAPVKRQLQDCLVPPLVAESAPAGYRKADESFR
jgi:hypothetical protein